MTLLITPRTVSKQVSKSFLLLVVKLQVLSLIRMPYITYTASLVNGATVTKGYLDLVSYQSQYAKLDSMEKVFKGLRSFTMTAWFNIRFYSIDSW